jgi:hypothetical protein
MNHLADGASRKPTGEKILKERVTVHGNLVPRETKSVDTHVAKTLNNEVGGASEC